MAIANSDGSIILSTKVDTSGVKEGFKEANRFAEMSANKQRSLAQSLSGVYRKQGLSQSEAQKLAWKGLKDGTVAAEDYKRALQDVENKTKGIGTKSQESGKQAKTAISTVGTALKGLAVQLGLVFSVTQLIQFSKASGELATQTEASVQRLIDIYGEASKDVGLFIDTNARALGMSKASAASFASVYGNLFSVWADQATNAQLTTRYLNATAVVASKTGRTMADVQERIRSGLLGNTEAVEDLGIFVNVKTIEMTEAFKRVADGRSWEQLTAYEQSQVRTLAILEQATNKYGNQVAETTALTRARFSAAFEDFKNTWGQVVNLVLIPVLKVLTQVFTVATAGLNFLMGKTGSIADQTSNISSSIGGAADNQKDLTEEVNNTNKALKKTLAGFDDLQILSSGASEAAGGSDIGSISLPTTVSESEGSQTDPMVYAQKIKDAIDFLLPVVAIGLVVIGMLLIFLGNIPWGIGFIIGGAYLYSVSERSEGSFDFNIVKEDFEAVVENLDKILLAIGIVLLFLGQIAWGIGFMVAGAAYHAIKEIQGEEYDTASFETKLAVMTEAVAFALATIGVLLIFLGHIPLGLGFIVGGYKLLDISEQQLDEGGITTKIEQFFEDNRELIQGSGIALLIIGLLLLNIPSAFPKALAVMAAGASLLYADAEINGGAVSENFEKFFAENAALIVGVSIALIVIGILLCFIPSALPLGVGMIAMGATGLVTQVAIHWDTIINNLKNFFFENPKMISLISEGLLLLGILFCAVGVIPLGVGFLIAGAAGLVTEAVLHKDAIVEWVKSAWKAVKNFWNTHIAPIFTAAWWKNLGITCINGLIAGFEGGINGIIWAFESMINWIVEGINSISFDIPDWVPGIGGDTFGFNIPEASFGRISIPRLAKGAVIPANREFLAVLGDQRQGVNIETPLETMIEAFQMALDSRGGTGTTEVVLEIDGREFGRTVVEQGNKENRRIGTRLVIV